MPPTRELLWAFVLSALLSAAYFYVLITGSFTILGSDLAAFFFPSYRLWIEQVQQGQWPLWDATNGYGSPLLARPQTAVFYPFHLLYLIFPFYTAANTLIVFHYALAGFGMFWLARSLGASRQAAFLSALIFMSGGYLMSLCYYLSTLYPIAWAPLLILFYFYGLQRRKYAGSAAAALVAALMFFAAGMETLFQTGIWIGLFTLAPQLLFRSSIDASFGWRIRYLLLFGLLVFGLVAVQMWPTYELYEYTNRKTGLMWAEATHWSFKFKDLLLFFMLDPYSYLTKMSQPGDKQIWMRSLYVGLIPFLLSLVYWVHGGPVRRFGTAIVVLISVGVALGRHSFIHTFFYDWVPFFSSFRFPIKFLFPAIVCLCLSAGWGWDQLRRRLQQRGALGVTWSQGFLCLAALCMVLFGVTDSFPDWIYQKLLVLFPGVRDQSPEVNLYNFNRLMIFSALFSLAVYAAGKWRNNKQTGLKVAIMICALDIFFCNQGAYLKVPLKDAESLSPETQYLQGLASPKRIAIGPGIEFKVPRRKFRKRVRGVAMVGVAVSHDIQTVTGVNRAKGYTVMRIQRVKTINDLLVSSSLSERVPWLRMLNIGHVLSVDKLPPPDFRLEFDPPPLPPEFRQHNFDVTQPKVYTVNETLGPAFLVGGCRLLPGPGQVLQAMQHPEFDPQKTVLLSEAPKRLPCSESGIAPPEGMVRLLDQKSGSQRFQAQTSKPAWLFLPDTYFPGWEAEVDGVSTPIYRANYTFRAIELDAGDHEVRFVYRPGPFWWGLGLSLVSLMGVMRILIRRPVRTRSS